MKVTDYECVGQCLDGEKCCWDQYTEDVKKMAPTKLYIASKLKHAQRWRVLREVRKESFEFVCSWIDGGEEEGRPTSYAEMWERYAKEIRDCDVMIVYVEPGEVLKGALVEMGIALGARKAVIICGMADADPFKTVQHHPCVLGRVRHIGSALKLAKLHQGWQGAKDSAEDALSPQRELDRLLKDDDHFSELLRRHYAARLPASLPRKDYLFEFWAGPNMVRVRTISAVSRHSAELAAKDMAEGLSERYYMGKPLVPIQWLAKKVFTFELVPISGGPKVATWKEINETVSGARVALRQKVKTDGLNVRLVRVERY